MPKNVMKLSKPSPHRARNDFDLSHRHVFSANFGELLPSTCIETVPGDHIELHASDLIRAIPLVTSPFMRAKQHIDVWYVPYQDLWHQFNNFITKKSQPVSSALHDFQYLPWINLYDLYDAVGNSTATDVVGIGIASGSRRILNLLGYGGAKVGASATSVSVNPFRLYAYNYIWYNEYRQKYFDDGTNALTNITNPSFLFNADDLSCYDLASAQITSAELLAALPQMRYRTWKRDLYTGLMPSTQFGSVSSIGNGFIQPTVVTANMNPVSSAALSTSSAGKLRGSSTVSNGAAPTNWASSVVGLNFEGSGLDVLALRRSEAIQIWRENALRAGNRVKDNMEAHYGIESDFRDHRPTFLGSVSSPLNIGDVMTTANSTTGINDTVGDIAGKGLSSLDEKVFKYDAKDFGIIMAIMSILPEAEYNATGVSRPNQLLEAEDFFIPEYENIGLEAVSSINFQNVPKNTAKVVGYAPRYYGYKTKLDKCYDIFRTGGINAPWCSPKYDVTTAMGTPAGVIPLSTLYVNPAIFDVNFSVASSVQPQFLVDVYFEVDAVRPMSVIGLPFS